MLQRDNSENDPAFPSELSDDLCDNIKENGAEQEKRSYLCNKNYD